ncbi:hypothetical protein PDJAM_G00021920 [Pangasius djambal]|uniref:Uncharacterized protein n=1 Tax=Pangasius djambal TaxID=1691987 RepID=A0ACC5YNM0_9TELE|nr:hypothetical protein [Pangasius djambal]
MALFPAFGGVSDADNSKNTALEWLSNRSFSSVDALSLHQHAIHRDTEETHTPRHTHTSEQKSDEDDDEDDTRSKKRRKKEKKRKRKKQKKHSREDSENSDSDTVYPSDLLNRELEPSQRQEDLVNVGGVLWLDDLQCPSEKLFYMDRKSDPANWEYKSLYRAHIARYKRKGSSALGLDSRTQGVCWEDSAPDRKRKEKRDERYFSPSNRRLLSSETPPTLSAPPTDSTLSTDPASFIPLPPSKEEPDSAPHTGTSTSTNPLRVYDLATSLWLEGKGQPEVKDQVQLPHSNMLMARVEEFNRKLRENPTDVNMWLEFIQFQDEVGGSLSGQGAESERALWDRKLSVVERALQLNPGSVELKLHRLRLGRGLWDSTTQLKEWKKVVFIHPNSAPLWRSYILFTQSQFSSFSVPMVTSVYRKCLSTLSAVQDGQLTRTHSLPPVSPYRCRREAVLDFLFDDVWQELIGCMEELLLRLWEGCSSDEEKSSASLSPAHHQSHNPSGLKSSTSGTLPRLGPQPQHTPNALHTPSTKSRGSKAPAGDRLSSSAMTLSRNTLLPPIGTADKEHTHTGHHTRLSQRHRAPSSHAHSAVADEAGSLLAFSRPSTTHTFRSDTPHRRSFTVLDSGGPARPGRASVGTDSLGIGVTGISLGISSSSFLDSFTLHTLDHSPIEDGAEPEGRALPPALLVPVSLQSHSKGGLMTRSNRPGP